MERSDYLDVKAGLNAQEFKRISGIKENSLINSKREPLHLWPHWHAWFEV